MYADRRRHVFRLLSMIASVAPEKDTGLSHVAAHASCYKKLGL
jgi:hypothetical protein